MRAIFQLKMDKQTPPYFNRIGKGWQGRGTLREYPRQCVPQSPPRGAGTSVLTKFLQ